MSEREMVSADEARVCADRGRTGHGDSLTARLARTVIALHAIIEGRTVPPTDDELAAHDAAGALWMIAHRDGQIVVTAMSAAVVARLARREGRRCDGGRWRSMGARARGRRCPVAETWRVVLASGEVLGLLRRRVRAATRRAWRSRGTARCGTGPSRRSSPR